MQITARVSSDYRWRLGLVGAMVMAFALWFIYDAAVGYPAKREHYRVYEELLVQAKDPDGWKTYAAEHKLPESLPGSYNKRDQDITTQWVCGLLCLPIGLLVLGKWFSSGSWWVTSDGSMLKTNRGQQVPFDAIRSLDTSRWRTKGIAVAHYELDGKPGKIVLDDWKYQRGPTLQIFNQVRAFLHPDEVAAEAAAAKQAESQAAGEADTTADSAGDPAPDAT